MKKRRRLVAVAVLLVAIAIINVFVVVPMETIDSPLNRGWWLFLTVILSIFLALGKNTARWIAAILTCLGALAGLAGVAILLAADAKIPLGVVAWMGVMTVLYTAISAFLAFSPGVAREIRRASALVS